MHFPIFRIANLAQTFIRAKCQGLRTKYGVTISPLASVKRMGGSIQLGRYTQVHRGALIWAYGGQVVIGDHCTVNPYTIIYGHGDITIGNNVRIAAHVVLIPSNHETLRDEPIYLQPVTGTGIRIGDDVWIGAGSRILDGVTIASGCVIGAGSVVTKSTDPYGIYAGVPARKIGERQWSETRKAGSRDHLAASAVQAING